MTFKKELSPRDQHRQEEMARVNASDFLSRRYPNLKSLCIEYEYFDAEGRSRNRQIKFSPNLDKARSVLIIHCIDDDCGGGDFDLTQILSRAIEDQKDDVEGEIHCPGRHPARSETCNAILRYQLSMEYHSG